jgi:hypothetical protein
MALLRNRMVAAVVGLLVGVLLAFSSAAVAQSFQVKHHACYYNPSGTQQTQTQLHYLPNGSLPCAANWTKIDWLDD